MMKVRVKRGAYAIDTRYHGTIVEVSESSGSWYEPELKYRIHGTIHAWIYKRDCIMIETKVGGELVDEQEKTV